MYCIYRPDDIIKALVYKVVPALFQSEAQRTEAFNIKHGVNVDDQQSQQQQQPQQPSDKSAIHQQRQKQHYFAPDEPIR